MARPSLTVLSLVSALGLAGAAAAGQPLLRFDFTGGSPANTGLGLQTGNAQSPGMVATIGGLDGLGSYRNHAAPADGASPSEQRGRFSGAGLPDDLHSLTVCLWLKADVPFAGGPRSDVSLFDSGGFSLAARSVPAGSGRWEVRTGNGTQPAIRFDRTVDSTPDFGAGDIGQWRFLAATLDMVFDGSATTTTVKLYRGSLTEPVALWGAGTRVQDGDRTTQVTGGFAIGNSRLGERSSTQRQFLGEIDDVRFYASDISGGAALGEGELEEVRVSSAGGPGRRSRPGDADGDGKVDLSDAVGLLGYLFRGNPERLRCGDGSALDAGNLKALDSNGDGRLDLSDPVWVLRFLFGGGPPHAAGTECIALEGCPPACE